MRANSNLHAGLFRITAPDPATGVTIFFVISGFILPYSLWRGGYVNKDYGRFILKRIARLDPPYFVSIAASLAIAYMATLVPVYRGVPFAVSGSQLLLHIGYLIPFFKAPWIIPVYWTLAIEFQYYVILGLVFPWILSGNRLLFTAFVAVCVVSQCVSFNSVFLPMHWPLFLMGIVVFRYKAHIISPSEALAWTAAFACWMVVASVIGAPDDLVTIAPQAVVGAISALSIMYLAWGNSLTVFFADISYSLYLVHLPVGGRIVNLGARYATNPFSSVLVALAAVGGSIACAYPLYRWVEKPSQRLAGRIKYRAEAARFATSAAPVSQPPASEDAQRITSSPLPS
jgi:peptidoglycan/LPS O-acetylase OafA/YrhL